jgi:dTDP-4-amino-4,6-dideoxygalactose transaminase
MSETMHIDYHGFARRAEGTADAIVEIVGAVGMVGELILRDRVAELERAVSKRVGVAEAIAVANGSGALRIALGALETGSGDEVVTSAFGHVAPAAAIASSGAKVVFADADPVTLALDPAAARAAVTSATRAILPSHAGSCYAAMADFRALAASCGAALVENSAVAFGGLLEGAPVGGHGDVGVFSFWPGKPAGGIGDAGMIVTDDATVAALCRMWRNHGQTPAARFLHHFCGLNCRMDEIVAAFLVRRLPHVDGLLERRRAIARTYNELLAPLAPVLVTPPDGYGGRVVYTYVVRAQQREALRRHLRHRGVETVVHVPRALPLQGAFAALGHRPGEFPVSERLARECVALPLYPELTEGEVEHVAASVCEFYGGHA